jgi:hypothetical protein
MMFEDWKKKTKVTLVAGLLALAGCATARVPLSSTRDVPAAQGTVMTSMTKNNNTAIDVRVKHLADPGKVESGATTYVVWARPEGSGQPRNLGALKVGDDLTGQLKTVTPYSGFELFITAEPSAQVTSPQGQELLSAYVPPAGR